MANKLAAKMVEVMKDCSFIAKAGKNEYHGYKYATSADVLEKVNASLTKNGIASTVVPELISMVDVQTSRGSIEHLATVKVMVTLTDISSGEAMGLAGIGGGQDSGDKAVMKAQTAALKYAYLMSLAISTGDDPEADARTDENTAVAANTPARATGRTSRTSSRATGCVCSACGSKITEKVMQYSTNRFGAPLCMSCQQEQQASA